MDLFDFFLISMGINIAMFFPAYFFKTDKLTDISYSLSFIVVALFAFLQSDMSVAATVLLGMVVLWAIRLGGYLLFRIFKMKRDRRFDDMRSKPLSFLKFWLLQGFSVWVVSLPFLVVFTEVTIEKVCGFGLLIFAAGLLIETIADYQKYTFIVQKKNPGKWIQSGLWKYSRHPNYFGEMLVWIGICLFGIRNLDIQQIIVSAIGPLYIIILISFVSGIPLLEKAAEKRWGSDNEYKEYKKKTSILVPWFIKKSK